MQSRRSFLRGAGGVFGVADVEIRAEQHKPAQSVKRFVAASNPFGFYPDAFFPNQAGLNYDLPLF